MNDISVNKVNRCFAGCDESVIGFCRHCGQDFCQKHQSKLDDRYCSEHINDSNTTIEYRPLTEDDGTTHQGRQVKLIGEGWPNMLEMIRTLSDDDLEFKLGEWQRLLQESIKTTEFFRIAVSATMFEKEDRYRSKVRKLERRRKEIEKQSTEKKNGKLRSVSAKSAKADPVELLAKQMGISVEVARQVMKTLGKA